MSLRNRPPDYDLSTPRGRSAASFENPSQKLIHDDSGYSFIFQLPEKSAPPKAHAVVLRPGPETPSMRRSGLMWDRVLELFTQWLIHLEEEYYTTNPWEELKRAQQAVDELADGISRDEHFSPEEQEFVRGRLDDFEQRLLRQQDFDPGEIEFLKAEVSDLREEIESLKKWRWAKMGIGTVARIGFTLAFPDDQLSQLTEDFFSIFRDLPQLPND